MTLIAILVLHTAAAQTPLSASADELYRTMARLDREMFRAFNECRPADLAAYFEDDFEFYHDQTGLAIGVAHLIEQQKKNICGKVRRELVAGSLKVYPMKGYGALVTGVHRFYQPADRPDPTGIAQFVHLWRWKQGVWRVTRVISYDHKGLDQAASGRPRM